MKLGVNFIKSLDTVEELSQFDTNNSLNSQNGSLNTTTENRTHVDQNAEAAVDCPAEPGGQHDAGINQDDKAEEQHVPVHLSQVESQDMTHYTPVTKTSRTSAEMKSSKKKKKRRNTGRQKRLLKFHEKLVRTCGLPASRLMEMEKDKLLGKSISSEFQQLGEEDAGLDTNTGHVTARSPTTPTPVTEPSPSSPPPVIRVLMPEQLGGAQPLHQPPIGHGVSYHTPPAVPALSLILAVQWCKMVGQAKDGLQWVGWCHSIWIAIREY